MYMSIHRCAFMMDISHYAVMQLFKEKTAF